MHNTSMTTRKQYVQFAEEIRQSWPFKTASLNSIGSGAVVQFSWQNSGVIESNFDEKQIGL